MSNQDKSGWTRVKFGEVVRQVKNVIDPKTSGLERYIAGEHMDTDDLRINRWGTIDDGYLGPAFHMHFKPGQVLYGSRRTYLRKVAMPDFEGICANTTFVLEPKNPNVLDPGLLPFLMQTEAFHDHSIKQSKGSVNPYVNFSDLAWYEFILPPIDKQRLLASVFRALDQLTYGLSDATVACWMVLKSALSTILCYGSDPFSVPPNLPAGWSFVPLGDLLEVKHGFAFPGENFVDGNSDYPILLTPKNFSETGDLLFTPDRIRRYSGTPPSDFWLKPGDLVILMTDLTPTARLLGAPGIVGNGKPVLHNQRIGLIQVFDTNLVTPDFLFFTFLGEQLRRLIRAQATGSTVSHTSPTKIRSLCIPLPPKTIQDQLTRQWWRILNSHRDLSRKALASKALVALYRERSLAGIQRGL